MSTAPAAAGGGTGVVRLARFGESPAALTFRRNEPSEPLSAALVALAELRQADALPPGTHGLIKEMLLGQAHDATVAGLLAAYDVERDGLELRDSLARFAQRLAAHGAPADFASYRPPAPPAPPAAPPVPQTLVPTPPAVPVRREEVRVLHEASDEDDDERDARADEALPFPSLPPLRDPGACVATGGEWRALDDGAVLCYAANAAAHAVPGGGGRVAVFGWEGTLVASGAGELLRPHAAPAFLRALSRGGYRLVVADHARAMGRGVERADYEQLTARLAAAIGAPLLFLLSCAPSHRPPAAPFLRLLAAHVPTAPHERADSFVVGSAAGRGGDRSAADRLMARRLRLAFRTPEELWDDAPPAPFAWRRAAAAAPPAPLIVGSPDARTVSEEELQALPPPALVLLVGAPAAGKTFAARRLWTRPGWAVVAPDAALVAAALGAGLGVLVDGAPPAAAARAPFLELARAHGVAAHALLLGTSEATAAVLSRLRVALGEARREAARGATAAFKRAYTPPTHAEGFASVLLLPFAPAFDSAHAAATYRSLLAA